MAIAAGGGAAAMVAYRSGTWNSVPQEVTDNVFQDERASPSIVTLSSANWITAGSLVDRNQFWKTGGAAGTTLINDSGQGTPEAQLVPVAARVAPGAAGWAALANDRAQLGVLERGRAVALALGSGAVVANVSACSSSGQCAIACVYEPFVFA